MRFAALMILAAVLVACGEKPPTAPAAEAVGAELATFPQLLVPISSSTWMSMLQAAENNNAESAKASWYLRPYAHVEVLVAGRRADTLIAYTSVWLAPTPVPLQPMSVQQYLRAFDADTGADIASVVAPKGKIFFTREQLPDVKFAAKNAGAGFDDLPYSVILSSAR